MIRFWQKLKNLYHLAQAWYWRLYFGQPDRGMKIYGVTGTNGKTTTCYLLTSILGKEYGVKKTGMLTTVAFRIGEKEISNETKMTTLPSRLVFDYLGKMRTAGVNQVVLEMTSHALDQNRLFGIKLDGAAILNIACEHLDYHRTMTEYAAAKLKILNYVRDGGTIVHRQFPIPNSQFPNLELIQFSAKDAADVVTSLLGEVNKENVLAASLLARAAGVKEENIASGVAAVKLVPGRMEWVKPKFSMTNDQFPISGLPRVLIDYAVTPDALERLYKEVKRQTKGKVFAVLGACGLRDRGKRPDMARAAARFTDEVVLTREDPWTEDEEQIFTDLEKGLEKTDKKWRRIVDRREAIRYCLERAGKDDVVVVTGKGAEQGMAIGKKIVLWSDREVILEEMEDLAERKT
ncbi:MAG: Mur ligase family protein [Candidatus Andersenbacteria bacterium]|nr:Mur ligase family protein [bacterium]MDZ4225683.1 Mur ligase family protein [Candidatus Andersenbacteria bacterium]